MEVAGELALTDLDLNVVTTVSVHPEGVVQAPLAQTIVLNESLDFFRLGSQLSAGSLSKLTSEIVKVPIQERENLSLILRRGPEPHLRIAFGSGEE